MTEDPVEVPIDGVLDLHTFRPRDLPDLIPDYLGECQRAGLLEVRIIHGKGTGALRRSVEAVLGRLVGTRVRSFGPAPEGQGGWGATVVFLTALPTGERR